VRRSSFVVALVVGALLAGCSPDSDPSAAPSASVTPSSAAPSSVSPTASPSASPTVTPTPPKPTPPKPTPPKPTPKPTPKPGTVLTAKGAYLGVSEDENLTTPDPENGCEAHDPDLTQVSCGVHTLAGGTVTWVAGYEDHNLPGESEPRYVVRVYQRLANGSDSMTHAGFGDPGTWAEGSARVGSLTGQANDSLVVFVTFRGSGTLKGYDLLTWRAGGAGPVLRAHRGEISHGQFFVRTQGYVSGYEADYSDGAPNCCPTSWKHENVYWDGSAFRLRFFPNVAEPPAS
jgi:hypothetical protein